MIFWLCRAVCVDCVDGSGLQKFCPLSLCPHAARCGGLSGLAVLFTCRRAFAAHGGVPAALGLLVDLSCFSALSDIIPYVFRDLIKIFVIKIAVMP